MSGSALFLAGSGILATFAPQEIAGHFGMAANPFAVTLVQAVGALYLGFALMNWMAREVLIGGIYSRPVAVGNFLHFAVGAITLLKLVVHGWTSSAMPAGAAIYSLFAVGFGMVVFGGSPTTKTPVP